MTVDIVVMGMVDPIFSCGNKHALYFSRKILRDFLHELESVWGKRPDHAKKATKEAIYLQWEPKKKKQSILLEEGVQH